MPAAADAIVQMDGPMLTRYALGLGLFAAVDDPGQTVAVDIVTGDVSYFPPGDGETVWRPHADLAQADAVFRSLRARGWSTSDEWYGTLGYGVVLARKVFGVQTEWTVHRDEYVKYPIAQARGLSLPGKGALPVHWRD